VRRALPIAAALALAALAVGAPPRAAGPEPQRARIAIAPFEVQAPPGSETPDLATLLADRIATRGVERIVGPRELGVAPLAEPEDADVRAWAKAAGVSAVAVGRTTRIGSHVSVDVRLRSGESGALAGTYVSEILRPADLEAAVDRLADQLIGAAAALAAPGGLPAVSAAERAGGRSGQAAPSSPFGLAGAFDSDQPLSIESEQLEAFQQEGRRRLVFQRHVKVVQGEITLHSDRLEAFYPEGTSQPDRLVASGNVQLLKRQSNGPLQSARCQTATYDRSHDRLVCSGNAELAEGDDRVRGSEIEFDLARESVVVKGGASVLIHPEPEKPQAEAPAPGDGA
jgi:lipopolysaccharide transport protein LptA